MKYGYVVLQIETNESRSVEIIDQKANALVHMNRLAWSVLTKRTYWQWRISRPRRKCRVTYMVHIMITISQL